MAEKMLNRSPRQASYWGRRAYRPRLSFGFRAPMAATKGSDAAQEGSGIAKAIDEQMRNRHHPWHPALNISASPVAPRL